MQTRGKLFDDLSQLMTNAAGMAQGMREEAETVMRSAFERWISESNLVTQEEFEAVREMALKARAENETLRARLDEMEVKLGQEGGGAA